MDFTGKVALITGGGGGIGRATALGFAARGARVMVVDHDEAAGEASVGVVRQQGGEARFTRADVALAADVRRYVQATLDAWGRDRLLLQQCRHRRQGRGPSRTTTTTCSTG